MFRIQDQNCFFVEAHLRFSGILDLWISLKLWGCLQTWTWWRDPPDSARWKHTVMTQFPDATHLFVMDISKNNQTKKTILLSVKNLTACISTSTISTASTAAHSSKHGILWAGYGANFALPIMNPTWHWFSSLVTRLCLWEIPGSSSGVNVQLRQSYHRSLPVFDKPCLALQLNCGWVWLIICACSLDTGLSHLIRRSNSSLGVNASSSMTLGKDVFRVVVELH